MKRIFAIMLLIATPVGAIAGPVIPSADDRRNLEAAIKSIEMVRDQDQANGKGTTQKIEEIIGLRDKKGKLLRPSLTDPNYNVVTTQSMDRELGLMQDFDAKVAERFAQLSVQQRTDYDAATQAHKRYQQELRPLCGQALELAQKAFHISPRNADGTIVNGPPPPETDDDFPSFQGKRAVWKPVYHETQDPINFGFTDPDGHVGITLEAFRDADRLGFVLYHESLHFDDLLDAAKDAKNDPAGEVRHREGARRLIGSVFKLKSDDIKNNDKVIGDEKPRAERWRQVMARGLNPWKKSQRAAFPGNYKSLWMQGRLTDDGGAYTGRPEPTKEQADMSFLDSWRQAAAPLIDKAKAAQALQEAERQNRQREQEELLARKQAEKEWKKQAFRTEMDEEAASCGYRMIYDSDNETMLGYGDRSDSFLLSRYAVPFDFGDMKAVWLTTRVCREIESHPYQPAPTACNGAASLLHERMGRGDFMPKVRHLTQGSVSGYLEYSDCLKNILANADKITDTESFDKIVSSYQKILIKRLSEEAKREGRKPEEDRGGRGSPPQGGRDRDCYRNGDPFGCQPR